MTFSPAHSRESGNRALSRPAGSPSQVGSSRLAHDEWRTSGIPDVRARGRAEHVVVVSRISLHADPAGALYWPEHGLLAVADLHLEKGSSFAARGQLLPPYDTAETLARLARLIAHYAPRVVIALGDNFHDGGGAAPAHRRESRVAARAAARPRLDLDHRQSRSRTGSRHRRIVSRNAHAQWRDLPPSADRRAGRHLRPSASGRAHRASRPRGQPALLRGRSDEAGDAGLRRLHRRLECT